MRHLTTTLSTTLAATLALTASVLLAAPADALRESDHDAPDAARGGLRCAIGVVGFDSGHHIRSDSFTNGRLTSSRTSTTALPFDATAFGYYSSKGTSRRNTLELNVVTADGVPRHVVVTRTRDTLKAGKVRKYDQRSFRPRLFADGGTFYAYTVNGATLKRWTLTRYPDGDVRFAQPVRVRGGFGDVTSLQAASYTRVRGVASELLYATTADGQLLQVVVPFKNPGRARVHRLARSGYAGVTELSWSLCNGKGDFHTLIAIDPVANRAVWTTIKHAFTRPKATLQGDVTGVTDWNLTAAF